MALGYASFLYGKPNFSRPEITCQPGEQVVHRHVRTCLSAHSFYTTQVTWLGSRSVTVVHPENSVRRILPALTDIAIPGLLSLVPSVIAHSAPDRIFGTDSGSWARRVPSQAAREHRLGCGKIFCMLRIYNKAHRLADGPCLCLRVFRYVTLTGGGVTASELFTFQAGWWTRPLVITRQSQVQIPPPLSVPDEIGDVRRRWRIS